MSQVTEIQINPCRFCGEDVFLEPSHVQDRYGIIQHSVKCLKCRARGPYASSEQVSLNLWNAPIPTGWDR